MAGNTGMAPLQSRDMMASERAPLLLTRPEAAAQRFAAEFRARFGADWPVVTSPLMRTEWLSPALSPAGADVVVFTSENGVRGFARLCPDARPLAYCVGPRTAEVARSAGFEAETGAGDGAALARRIVADRPGGEILWPRGRRAGHDLAADLGTAGLMVTPLIVYDQVELAPTEEARRLLAGDRRVMVPLFSPRSACLFAGVARESRAPLGVAAISQAAADAADVLFPAALAIAARPDGGGLLDALEEIVLWASGS